MASYYSDEQVEQLESDRQLWLSQSESLFETVLFHCYDNNRAGKYARTGFARRLGYLTHAIIKIWDVYPPNLSNASRETVRDAELILQAFVMNVFGAIDNLAWIWALEKGVTRPNGRALSPSEMVFVGSRARFMIESLTPNVRTAISNASEWFDQIGSYRHGVAHQIPIYIPCLLSPIDLAESNRLSAAIEEAALARDNTKIAELLDKRNGLGDYGAMMALNDERPPMILHAQVICDLATVINIGQAIFRDLSVV